MFKQNLVQQRPPSESYPPELHTFIPEHISYELQQVQQCIDYLIPEYTDIAEKFIGMYLIFLNTKIKLYKSKCRVIGFYLVELGHDPMVISRSGYEEWFEDFPLRLICNDSNPEYVQKAIRRAGYFNPGSSGYEQAKTDFETDYRFAMSLIS